MDLKCKKSSNGFKMQKKSTNGFKMQKSTNGFKKQKKKKKKKLLMDLKSKKSVYNTLGNDHWR